MVGKSILGSRSSYWKKFYSYNSEKEGLAHSQLILKWYIFFVGEKLKLGFHVPEGKNFVSYLRWFLGEVLTQCYWYVMIACNLAITLSSSSRVQPGRWWWGLIYKTHSFWKCLACSFYKILFMCLYACT